MGPVPRCVRARRGAGPRPAGAAVGAVPRQCRTALDQAGRITEESARYNIGNINRTINVPTMALEFLTPEHRSRFDFEFERGLTTGVQVVRYIERRGPTYIRTTGNRNLPASGRYWIHEASGLVERTELRVAELGLEGLITVSYRLDDLAEPMGTRSHGREYAQKNDRSEIRGTAVYSRYRALSDHHLGRAGKIRHRSYH